VVQINKSAEKSFFLHIFFNGDICFGDVEELNITLITAPQVIAPAAEWCHCRDAF